jgi:hypothetical protein
MRSSLGRSLLYAVGIGVTGAFSQWMAVLSIPT